MEDHGAPYEKVPPYQPPNHSDQSGGGSQMSQPEHSPKALYALSLQNSCNAVLRQMQDSPLIQDVGWAKPLETAPTAITIMATLFKAADNRFVSGLEVGSVEVMDERGTTVEGRLPSLNFRASLQYCSNVGRDAFRVAQTGMNQIREISASIIGPRGSVGYIIDLLDDPEDARINLKPQIKIVKERAEKCLTSARILATKFQYWHRVIVHLQETSLSRHGEVQVQKQKTEHEFERAELATEKLKGKQQAKQQKLFDIQQSLAKVKAEVDEAHAAVMQLRNQEPIADPTVKQEMLDAAEVVRHRPAPPPPDRGLLQKGWDAIFGKSPEDEAADAARVKKHEATIEKERQQYLQEEREKRERQRKQAEARLEMAQQEEARVRNVLVQAQKELWSSRDELEQAKADYRASQRDLNTLCEKGVELDEILKVLENSRKHLTKLKEQVEGLVVFVENLLVGVEQTFERDVEDFLSPITNAIGSDMSTQLTRPVQIGKPSKRRMLESALQLQCRCSEIADIARAYVLVSDKYIRPSLDRMEKLASLEGEAYDQEKVQFEQFLQKCLDEIPELTQKINDQREPRLEQVLEEQRLRLIENHGVTA